MVCVCESEKGEGEWWMMDDGWWDEERSKVDGGWKQSV